METKDMLNSTAIAPPKSSISVKIDQIETPARSRLGTDFMKLMPVLVDVVLVMLAFEVGRQIDALFNNAKAYPWPSASIYTVMLVFSMYLNEMYAFWQQRNTAELITSIMRSMGLALIAVAPILYLFPGLIERWFLTAALCSQFILLLSWRTFLERRLIKELARQRVLIIGSGERARRIREALATKGSMIFELVGCTVDRLGEDSSKSCRHVGPTGDICDMVRREQIDHVVVAQDNPRDVFPANALLKLKRDGVAISEGEYLYERLMGKLLTDYVRPSVLIFSASPMHHTLQIWAKNTLDFIIASALLILTAPIMLVAGIMIKLTSKGPIVYSQTRVGLGGRPFTIYKFRSMRTDAEKDGAKWATKNDSRITAIGKIMRFSRIDELPQLINVLRGDMSMVGPRPERPEFVRKLQESIPFYEMRHMMRPGLSGWAQVRYQYANSIEDSHEKLRYDLYYIKNYSLAMDLTIMLETTKVVVFGSGAR
jgi:sugar transferase (PEP-CTERM system associated)